MPSVADYQVLHKDAFHLEIGEGVSNQLKFKDFIWKSPGARLVPGGNRAQYLFTFEVRPFSDDSAFWIKVNNNVVARGNYNASNTRSATSIFSFEDAFPSSDVPPNMPIQFECLGGSIDIKDLVIWYQVNVD